MYPKEFDDSLMAVTASRENNISYVPPQISLEEKNTLLALFHPDYDRTKLSELLVGPNKGDFLPHELCCMLHASCKVDCSEINLSHIDYTADVLIIGAGGAGCAAAIEASEYGADVLMISKMGIGNSNTVMAEGGIQAASNHSDSPVHHFIDAYGGGHFTSNRDLLAKLVLEAPSAIKWLIDLGVEFDRSPDGDLLCAHGGGTSQKRMHSAKDYTGSEIMRTLRDEVLNRSIRLLEFTSAIEIILDADGNAAGAILMDMDSEKYYIARAKTVIIATGGAGRLHYNGFSTSNHYGSTADGLVLGYRAGARLIDADSLQYHPTGSAYPSQTLGTLVTEKARSLGAKLLNRHGEIFINPLETRDVVTAAIIRECTDKGNGIKTQNGHAVWLDTPMIDIIHGKDTIEKKLPAMLRIFSRFDIDIRKEPILVYPTLHYQNGGLEINTDCMTPNVPNLYAAGEVTGGIHGRNRLMGNSLLEIIVFGRNAGRNAAIRASETTFKQLSLAHVERYNKEKTDAGVFSEKCSPILLPDYRNKVKDGKTNGTNN